MSATTSGPAPKQGGTLVVQGNQEVASLHPDDAGPLVQYVIVANLHDPLVQVDKDFQLQPVLAKSYEISTDGLTYTFRLQQGVKFHDGQEFTSKDVKYTFEWYADPANAAINGASFAGISSIETPDPYTAVIKRKTVNAAFMVNAATTFILPEHYHSKVGKAGYAAAPIGTGPFKLKEWKAAQQTTLVAFDDYFRGRPHIDVYQETNVPEESVRTIALQTGESDNSSWPLTAEENLQLMKDSRFLTLRAQNVAVNLIPLNLDKPALVDKSVRQAMMYAIDRDGMVNDREKGLAVKATSNLAPSLKFYYEPNVKLYPYDPNQAKSLLDAAGWKPGPGGIRAKDGVQLSFTCTIISGDQRNRSKAVLAQAGLANVGIEMKIGEQPVAAILEGLRKGSLEASMFNWTYGGSNGEPDARTTLRSDGASNFSHFKSARVDQLVDAGVATVVPEERKQAYSEIQKIVAEEVPFLYLMYWDWIEVWNKRVKGVPDSVANLSAPYQSIYTYSLA
ncbi:MAG: ABC transporter substrate-binding protein [Dehalococcoidia bacterium]